MKLESCGGGSPGGWEGFQVEVRQKIGNSVRGEGASSVGPYTSRDLMV